MLADEIDVLARAAKAGDSEARERLYGALRPLVRKHLRVRQAGGILDRADLEQEAFVILVDLLRRWRGRGPFVAWFQRVFPFALARYRRRVLRLGGPAVESMAPPDLVAAADARAAPDTLDPSERVFCHDLLRALPPPYRRLLWWRFGEGLTYREMEQQYGLPAASAQAACRRALIHLRALAQGENPPPLRVLRRRPGTGLDLPALALRLWALADAEGLLPSAQAAAISLGLGARAYEFLIARLRASGCIVHARGIAYTSHRGRRWHLAVDLAEARRRLADCHPPHGPL